MSRYNYYGKYVQFTLPNGSTEFGLVQSHDDETVTVTYGRKGRDKTTVPIEETELLNHLDDEDFGEADRVTYCPEDNKLRLYHSARLSRWNYLYLTTHGWTWSPKQGCDLVTTWTVSREDDARLLLADGADIDDEDYGPIERAEFRAARYAGYRDTRTMEAVGFLDAYEDGPAAYGHQNAHKAESAARRRDRLKLQSVTQWDKAEYWQYRTKAVLDHAGSKSSPGVRRGRVKKLESELIDLQKRVASSVEFYEFVDGLTSTEPLPADVDAMTPEQRRIHRIGERYEFSDVTTPAVIRDQFMQRFPNRPDANGTRSARWIGHLTMRIGYERAMLEFEGGNAMDVLMVKGGWVKLAYRTRNGGARCSDSPFHGDAHPSQAGFFRIVKVNKSAKTKNVVSVGVRGWTWWHRDEKTEANLTTLTINIERVGPECYLPPTADDVAEFQKVAESKPKPAAAPKLLNPTEADAKRLQALWNRDAEARQMARLTRDYTAERAAGYYRDEAVEIRFMTQADYSANSKGENAVFKTYDVLMHGRRDTRRDDVTPVAFRLRLSTSGSSLTTPERIIVLSDKKQNALPIDWELIESGSRDDIKDWLASPVEAEAVEEEAEAVEAEAVEEELADVLTSVDYVQQSLFS